MSFLVMILFFASIIMSATAFFYTLYIEKELAQHINNLAEQLEDTKENTLFLLKNHETRLRRTEDELFAPDD